MPVRNEYDMKEYRIGLASTRYRHENDLNTVRNEYGMKEYRIGLASTRYQPPLQAFLDPVYTMPVRNESGMKLFLFPNLLSRLHDTGTKSTLFEWVNQNESRNEWMNQNKIQMNESNLSRFIDQI